MNQLPCIKQYVPGYRLRTMIAMNNNLTDMIFNDHLYFDPPS